MMFTKGHMIGRCISQQLLMDTTQCEIDTRSSGIIINNRSNALKGDRFLHEIIKTIVISKGFMVSLLSGMKLYYL